MKIIVDERETGVYEKIQQLLAAHPETQSTVQIVKEVLHLGDFIITTADDRTVSIIERKSLTDLLASIKDSRYEEQSYRLSHSDEFLPSQVIYIIEGALNTLRTSSQQETAELLVWMADKMERNIQKGVPLYIENTHGNGEPTNTNENPQQTTEQSYCNVVKKVKKENVTKENIGEIMLCQVPGISAITAVAIMKHFTSFFHLLESCKNDPKCLENLKYESGGKMRKISKSSIASIFTFFLEKDTPLILDEN